uniref:Uncharacterized protein n=1 Tax=virus sp. ctDYl1 TaxID=2826795 RepID=A0A8S5RA77_9VIRU|nr:MAG TPA: hypothetical protein [virus sp. ctDYl1]
MNCHNKEQWNTEHHNAKYNISCYLPSIQHQVYLVGSRKLLRKLYLRTIENSARQ